MTLLNFLHIENKVRSAKELKTTFGQNQQLKMVFAE